MPWDLGVQQRQYDSTAAYKSEKQCQRTSFAFYQAVRDLLPVWALEDMRTMEVFHWEDTDGRGACAFTPSEAFLYALVHDHQQYARYLLGRYAVSALELPSRSFRCCQLSTGAPHLSVAVRYNRVAILKMILETAAKGFATEGEGARRGYLDSRDRGCAHNDAMEGTGGKTAVHLACDLVRPECLLLLLGHGACPYVTDGAGDNPLDCLLQQVAQGPANVPAEVRRKHVCLGYLLLFMPKLHFFRRKEQLLKSPQLWRSLVGEEAFGWLAGLSPPTLFVQAMRRLSCSVPVDQLEALPSFLKPLDFRV